MSKNRLDISLVYKENALPEEIDIVREGIINEAVKANMGRMTPFSFFMKDSKNHILGGVVGYTMYGLLYIDMLWVDTKFRSHGWGSKLVDAAENLGKKRSCTFSCLVTMSWQALPMYQKLGYQIEYTKEGFENNTKMYCLRKSL